MALYDALSHIGILVFQLHSFHPEVILHNPPSQSAVWAYWHIIKPRRPAKIISLFRDPVAVMAADFFRKLRWFSGDKSTAESLVKIFHEQYLGQNRHQRIIKWYEEELGKFLGLNIRQFPSPAESGYIVFKQGVYECLLMNSNLPDKDKSRIIADFLGVQGLEIKKLNVIKEEETARLYEGFKNQLKIDLFYLQQIYSTEFVKHFFNKEEVDKFIKKWS